MNDIAFGVSSAAVIAILALTMHPASARSGAKHSISHAGGRGTVKAVRNTSTGHASGRHLHKSIKDKTSAPRPPAGPIPIPYPNQNQD